jgi:hypothetical protein
MTYECAYMFAVKDKAKPNIENIRGLNLAVDKRTTVQVTKVPLWHKMRKICMICFAKPGLTRRLLYSAKGIIFSNIPYVRYKRPGLFIRDKPIFPSERILHKDKDRKGSVGKKVQSWVSTAWRQDELVGGKQPVIK